MPIINASEMMISRDPQAILTAPAIGSGIGVAVYDPVAQAGGIIHFLLPDSSGMDPQKAGRLPCAFADSGIRSFLDQVFAAGMQKANLQITVAGGAQTINPLGFIDLGQRNCEAIANILGKKGLAVTRSDVGGHAVRSLRLAIGTGEVQIETRGQGVRPL